MQYDFSLAPGAAQSFDVVGKFIKYQNGTGLIRVRMSMGEYVDLLPGQGVFSVDYTRFTVTDRSNANNTGAILAGDFDFRDSRITGDVSIIDGSKAEVMTGSSFVVNRSGFSAAPGQFLTIQLWNPVASGKRIAINSMTLFASVDSSYSLFGNQVDLAVNPRDCWNKNIGGAISVARTNHLFAASSAPVELVAATTLGILSVKAGVGQVLAFKKPIILREGFGIGGVAQTAATTGGYIFDFEEF